MDIWRSLSGMLTVEFTGAAPENTLDRITRAKIPVSHVVQADDLTYRMLIRRRDYRNLEQILRRQGDRLEIVRKHGLYWKIRSLLHRPLLTGVWLFLFVSSCYLPTRIFFVTVDGNTTVPDRLILSAAEACGIRFGASRKLVRSEKIKNALLSSVPKLQWAGINTSGCTAVIAVRERVEEEKKSETTVVSNLVADRDGYILSATITSGTAHVVPGEAVTKGQLLISGYTDCGICIRAARAEGEIMAQTNRKLTAVMPADCVIIRQVPAARYKVSLIVGKKRINLWKDSRISDAGCGRMYEEYYVSLPGDFRLPVAICVDRYVPYVQETVVLPEEDAQHQLQGFSEQYLLRQMVAGQILEKQQKLSGFKGVYRLESDYVCTELIGREQREQIGVINGKRN